MLNRVLYKCPCKEKVVKLEIKINDLNEKIKILEQKIKELETKSLLETPESLCYTNTPNKKKQHFTYNLSLPRHDSLDTIQPLPSDNINSLDSLNKNFIDAQKSEDFAVF